MNELLVHLGNRFLPFPLSSKLVQKKNFKDDWNYDELRSIVISCINLRFGYKLD